MTTQEVIQFAIPAVISIILAPLSNSIFRKYVDPILPHSKMILRFLCASRPLAKDTLESILAGNGYLTRKSQIKYVNIVPKAAYYYVRFYY
jgi:hypothetical protein